MKLVLLLAIIAPVASTLALDIPKQAEKSELSTYFLSPTRIAWTSEKGVANADTLLKPASG